MINILSKQIGASLLNNSADYIEVQKYLSTLMV